MVYRTYNMLQDGQENYVFGLFDQFSARGHDAMLDDGWARQLARLYTPARYLIHTLQMGSAYLTQIAPASTISNCATYQTADALRWLTHTASSASNGPWPFVLEHLLDEPLPFDG